MELGLWDYEVLDLEMFVISSEYKVNQEYVQRELSRLEKEARK